MTGIDGMAMIGCERWDFGNFGPFSSALLRGILELKEKAKRSGWTDRYDGRVVSFRRGPIPGAGRLVATNGLTRPHGRH